MSLFMLVICLFWLCDTAQIVGGCSYSLEFKGCSKDKSSANIYSLAKPFIVSAIATTSDLKCADTPLSYRWEVDGKTSILTNRRKSLKVHPAILGLKPGFVSIRVIAQYLDFVPNWVNVNNGSLCFVQIIETDLNVHIWGLDTVYKCGVSTQIRLEATADYPENILSFKWYCPKTLCGRIPRGYPRLKFTTKINCGESFPIGVKVMVITTRNFSLANGVLYTDPNPRNIFITCEPDCHRANPNYPLVLKALLDGPEGKARSTVYKWFSVSKSLMEFRDIMAESNVLMINGGTLLPGSVYHLQVRTQNANKTFKIETMVPPDKLKCSVSPRSGITFETILSIKCKIVDWTQAYTYMVHEGNRKEILAMSTSPAFSQIRFGIQPLVVSMTDTLGQTRFTWLRVPMYKKHADEYLIAAQDLLRRMESSKEKDYFAILTEIDITTKRMGESSRIPSNFEFQLLEYLQNIKMCRPEAVCHSKFTNSLWRLIDIGILVHGNKPPADHYFLIVADLLLNQSLRLERVSHSYPSIYGMKLLLEPLYVAIRKSMTRIENLIKESIAEKNKTAWYVFFRKLARAHENSRYAMKEMIRFVVSHVTYPAPPFFISGIGTDQLTIIPNQPYYINWQSKNKSFDFEFTRKAIGDWAETRAPIAAAFVKYESTGFQRKSEKVAMGSIRELYTFMKTESGHWTEHSTLTVQVAIRTEDIGGTRVSYHGFRPEYPENNDVQTNDRLVSVHRFRVPYGHGAIVLDFPPSMKNKLRIHIKLSKWPTYNETTHGKLISMDRYIYKYTSTEDGHYVYIGILPASNGRLDYRFTVKLVRCVTLSGDEWRSRYCVYIMKKNLSLACACNHMSLLSVELSSPVQQVVVLPDEIVINTSIMEFGYVLFVLCIVIAILVVVFFYAVNRDAAERPERSAMYLDDNMPGHRIPYLISIHTGNRFRTCTSSSISIRLLGTRYMSQVHVMASSTLHAIGQGTDVWFVLFTYKSLGNVEVVEIWQNSKIIKESNWYCDRVEVYDIKKGALFIFPIESRLSTTRQYMAVNRKHGKEMSRTLHAREYFIAYTRDGHHWTSVFTLHPRSMSTHFERFLILAVVTSVAMLMSIVFQFNAAGYGLANFGVSCIAGCVAFVVGSFNAYIFLIGQRQSYNSISMVPLIEGPLRVIRAPISLAPDWEIQQNYWTRTAYFFSACLLVVCCCFILFIGWHYTKSRTLVWVITFSVALLLEAILNLIEIIGMAILIAVVNRVPIQHLTAVNIIPSKVKESRLKRNYRLALALKNRVKPMYKTPRLDLYKTPTFTVKHIRSIATVAILFILVSLLVLHYHFAHDYILVSAQRDFLTQSAHQYGVKFIQNRWDYYHFLLDTFIPSIHKTHWYQGTPLPTEVYETGRMNDSDLPSTTRGFWVDYITKVIGVPRLRMKRIWPDCRTRIAPVFRAHFSLAHGHWSVACDDHDLYDINWLKATGDVSRYKFFEHSSQSETLEGPVLGASATSYTGSGYVQDLHWTYNTSYLIVLDLQLEKWIDDLTRVVILSFNLFNVNIDRFTSITIVSEKLASGVFLTRMIFRSDTASSNDMSEVVIMFLVFSIGAVLVLHAAATVFVISRDGVLLYWTSATGITHMVMLVSGVVLIVSFIARAINRSALDEISVSSKDSYAMLQPYSASEYMAPFMIGLFILSIAIFGIFILFSIPHFLRMKYSVLMVRETNFIIGAAVYGADILFAYSFNHFGTMEVPNMAYMSAFKETAVKELGTSDLPLTLFLSTITFAFLTKVNIAAVVFSYLKADGFVRSWSGKSFDFDFPQIGSRVNHRVHISTSPIRWSESVDRIVYPEKYEEKETEVETEVEAEEETEGKTKTEKESIA